MTAEQDVDMRPIAPPISSQNTQHEFWFEVRDASDAVLVAQAAKEPIRKYIEVFSDVPFQSASHAPDPRAEQTFTVLLPSLEGADTVVLMRADGLPGISTSSLQARAGTRGATSGAFGTEVARFKLAK